jgi:hypothetical protein
MSIMNQHTGCHRGYVILLSTGAASTTDPSVRSVVPPD